MTDIHWHSWGRQAPPPHLFALVVSIPSFSANKGSISLGEGRGICSPTWFPMIWNFALLLTVHFFSEAISERKLLLLLHHQLWACRILSLQTNHALINYIYTTPELQKVMCGCSSEPTFVSHWPIYFLLNPLCSPSTVVYVPLFPFLLYLWKHSLDLQMCIFQFLWTVFWKNNNIISFIK